MAARGGAVHVATTRRHYKDREYVTHLLRRSYREDGKVKNETLANLSHLPVELIDLIRRGLKGERFVASGQAMRTVRSLPHGHVALVAAQAQLLGFPALLGPACRQRDIAYALIVARVVAPTSKLATISFWADTTIASDLGLGQVSPDEVLAAMDWLLSRQDSIEQALARRHLAAAENPSRMAMYDLSSSWVTGRCCPLAARGYSRDGKRGLPQIEYGLLTDPAGRPIAIQVFPGNTGDPTAFSAAVDTVREKFGLEKMVLVGDRGMITSARIDALRDLGGMGWITALRAPAIAALASAEGPLQPSLFDQANLAEISHPDYPGERLIACRNPALAEQRAHTRDALLAATETNLDKIAATVAAGRLKDPGVIGLRVGKIIGRHKMAKHFTLTIAPGEFSYTRNQDSITTEAALDGIYVIRTSVPEDNLGAADTVRAYKDLAHVERDFRSMKADDLDLRPIRHWLQDRVRAHVFICMLARYLLWHLQQAMAPLTFTDENPPAHHDPVAPARRSTHAESKAARKHNTNSEPTRSFQDLMRHLGTLTRNTILVNGSDTEFDQLTEPTPTQRRAFELLGSPIPLTLK